ncbi:hypothetical protein MPSEU_000324800 [Mayamaea pseudoterrestris]|nr:hypothetical protein MPSEU_000324800 [Mayamaea pseudoterrestris]
MTERKESSVFVKSSTFQMPLFFRKNDADAEQNDAKNAISSTSTAINNSSRDIHTLVAPPRDVPFGCFWNHNVSDDNDDGSTKKAAAAASSSRSLLQRLTDAQPSPTLSVTSNQTTLAGDHILDSLADDMVLNQNTSAFTLPVTQKMQVQTNDSNDLPMEIQVDQQPPNSTRSHSQTEETEASPPTSLDDNEHLVIQTSGTFESLSSDGSSENNEQTVPSPSSCSTTSTSSVRSSTSPSFMAAKQAFERFSVDASVGKKHPAKESDQFGEIRQAHTELTVSTDATNATGNNATLEVRRLESWNNEQEQASSVHLPQLLKANLEVKETVNEEPAKQLMLNDSVATEDSGDDYFSALLDADEQKLNMMADKGEAKAIVEESELLSSSLKSHQPTVQEDPFDWAYDVWKRKGLMAGEPHGPPRDIVQPTSLIAATPKKVASFDMDLSGVNELPIRSAKKNRLSLPAVPASAKKPGFDIILNRWREKTDNSTLPTYLSSKQQQLDEPALQEPKPHMGVRNQIIVASHVHESVRSVPVETSDNVAKSPVDEHDGMTAKKDPLPVDIASSSVIETTKPPRQLSTGSMAASRQSIDSMVSGGSLYKPVSQASRLVDQLSKQEERNYQTRQSASKSPPRNTRNFKTNVEQLIEDGSALGHAVSQKEKLENDARHSNHRKIATISRKNSPNEYSSVASVLSVGTKVSQSSTSAMSHDSRSSLQRHHSSHVMPPIIEDVPHVQIGLFPTVRRHVNEKPKANLNESLFENDSLATRSVRSSVTTASVSSRLISSDSPWKALLKMDEDESQLTPKKEHDGSRPWNRDVVIHKTYKQSFSPPTEQDAPCNCSSSVFSSNDEMVNLMLPLMGMACTCGKNSNKLVNAEEPTALENILRPWQCDFLAAFGIFRGDQLVKAQHRSAGPLASALRRYRRKHGMKSYPTESCAMALSIWSKTSKAFVRSIRRQLTTGFVGELKVPNTLYIISSFMDQMPIDRSDGAINTSASNQEVGLAASSTFESDFAEL